jgi:hypothetical protein
MVRRSTGGRKRARRGPDRSCVAAAQALQTSDQFPSGCGPAAPDGHVVDYPPPIAAHRSTAPALLLYRGRSQAQI